MIYDYAIDPEVILEFRTAKDFTRPMEWFGHGTHRVRAGYPGFKKWRKAIIQMMVSDTKIRPVEKSRIELIIKHFSKCQVFRDGVDYNGSVNWLEQAEHEATILPFQAILAKANPRNMEYVLTLEDLHESSSKYKLWKKPSSIISRDPESIADAFAPALKIGRHFKIVDPYFQFDGRYPVVLFNIIKRMMAERDDNPPDGFTIILGTVNAKTTEFFRKEIENFGSKFLRRFFKLKIDFFRIEQNGKAKLHNRYFLSNLGGINLGNSLVGSESGDDDANLMDREQYFDRWERYNNLDEKYDLIDATRLSISERGACLITSIDDSPVEPR